MPADNTQPSCYTLCLQPGASPLVSKSRPATAKSSGVPDAAAEGGDVAANPPSSRVAGQASSGGGPATAGHSSRRQKPGKVGELELETVVPLQGAILPVSEPP